MKSQNKQKGITLVALVITIIILLILAGITINSLTDSGLFGKAKEAKEKHERAQANEEGLLQDFEEEILDSTREKIIDDLEIVITNVGTTNIKEKIEIRNKFENAVYIYRLDGEIIAYTGDSTIIIGGETSDVQEGISIVEKSLELDTEYQITVEVLLGNGTIHKSSKKFRVGSEEGEKVNPSKPSIYADLEIITTSVGVKNVIEEIKVNGNYDNAVYTYLLNNKVVAYTKDNIIRIGKMEESETIMNGDEQSESDTEKKIILVDEKLEEGTEYQITVIVSEENGQTHKGTKRFKAGVVVCDVFAKIESDGKTAADLAEYGITYTYEGGNAETKYEELYKLGVGSSSGRNYNTYTLTIDYDTLVEKMGRANFTGIAAGFFQGAYCDANWGYTWAGSVRSEVRVEYTDETTQTVSTEETTQSADIGSREAWPNVAIYFDKNKKINSIKILIYESEKEYASAYGYINNIKLIL